MIVPLGLVYKLIILKPQIQKLTILYEIKKYKLKYSHNNMFSKYRIVDYFLAFFLMIFNQNYYYLYCFAELRLKRYKNAAIKYM